MGAMSDGTGRKRDWVTWLGVIAALIAAVGALWFNALTLRANSEQTRLAEQGQVTERFSRAVDQLGSEKLDIRMGGVYALERIMRDSTVDQGAIVEILCAFVRERAPVKPASPAPEFVRQERRRPATDVQAVLTVLARRDSKHDGRAVVDLRQTDLVGANMVGAPMHAAELGGSDLTYANFADADLSFAKLSGAKLIETHLPKANLTDGFLLKADLSGAQLAEANLTRANFSEASLRGAFLSRANLTRAFLWKADMTNAYLEGADLTNADLTGAKR
ncbi:MAG TPA: hypothetical protein DGG94_17270 [Micromonosporaceae bacterium]|nr:hypothetical protein [Micromonosporaceae bacterium]HCU51523.1 hypothetical protein [Micromonosporaceae bacterium]